MPRAHKKSRTRARSSRRASWRGMLRFGLVTFPVQAFNAHLREEGGVSFHQLHSKCGRRIHYEKVCPQHGAISNEEIVSGYEVSKGKYVEIEPEELDSLRTDQERALTLDSFIEPGEVDPIYFDGRMYFLAPDGEAAAESYSVLTAALSQKGRYAVGQVVLSGKEQVVLVRPYGDVLQMALLNYSAEMLDTRKLNLNLPAVKSHDRRVQMAEKLIESWVDRRFDFHKYVDRHLELVRKLIEAKSKGRKIEPPEEEEEPEVINLLEALQRSMSQGRAKSENRTTSAKPSRGGRSRAKRGRSPSRRRAS